MDERMFMWVSILELKTNGITTYADRSMPTPYAAGFRRKSRHHHNHLDNRQSESAREEPRPSLGADTMGRRTETVPREKFDAIELDAYGVTVGGSLVLC